jgi:hypothetical protein
VAFIHILPEGVEYNYNAIAGAEDANDGRRVLQASTVTLTIAKPAKEEVHVDKYGNFPMPYMLLFAGHYLVLLVSRVFAGECGH